VAESIGEGIMENASASLPPDRERGSGWRAIGKVLGWATAGMAVALLSCVLGAALFLQARDTGLWLSVLSALGLTSTEGRAAFAAGITLGFAVRSFHRPLLRLIGRGAVLGAIALAVCLPSAYSVHWEIGVLRYGIVGGAAGAIVALAQVVKQRRRRRQLEPQGQ
jgi:hypothetical protein